MELSPAQRKLAFAIIVLALAGLGAFLLWPGPAAARGQVSGSPPATGPPLARHTGPAAPATAGPAPSGGAANIYQWLPFSQADLAAAAGAVRQFCTDYETYSYTQSAGSYVGRMRGLVTPALAVTLERGFATPGLAQVRTQQKQSASGSGVITALRAFGPSSLIFVVTLTQKTYSTGRTGKTTTAVTSGDYAITVQRAGSGWQVNDIQLASAGNS
ncbi:MAG TPA: hypothetical protein VIX86_04685 [Streptosporangiaceae bacterium]